jgi:hypothetical protein
LYTRALFIFDLIRGKRCAAILREPLAVRDKKSVENRIVRALPARFRCSGNPPLFDRHHRNSPPIIGKPSM